MKFTCLIFLILLGMHFTSCNVEQKADSVDKKQLNINRSTSINWLTTIEKKEKFLIDIYYSDQNVRDVDRKHEILKRNNYDTKSYEYQEHLERMMYVDNVNFNKIKKYLDVHGYPNFKSSDPRAVRVFRLVCLHQPTYEKQLELFPHLHKAYIDSLIAPDDFSFLLNNMHLHKYGKSHPHAITNEKNIEQLLEKLDLN